MPTVASFLPRCSLIFPPSTSPPSSSPLLLSRAKPPPSSLPLRFGLSKPRLAVLVASSAAPFDEVDASGKSSARAWKKSILSNLVQEIEPLDLNLIQKDVPVETIDAMKRTISGMLGLLPSEQFRVLVEAFWDPVFKLLVSSMMTGYTLWNAEYRLCLERNLGVCEDNCEKRKVDINEDASNEITFDRIPTVFELSETDGLLPTSRNSEESSVVDDVGFENIGELPAEVQEYIHHLQSRLSSAQKDLEDLRRKNSALQMQQLVGEEKNDLLAYLRSLQPEKVAELSEPACSTVQETIHSVVHGLLATLSPRMHSKVPPSSENAPGGTLNLGKDDCSELVENTSIQFQPMISLSRDYLARLLFWCMLLGHYLRGLEYRLELMQILTISGDQRTTNLDGDSVS